MPSGPNTRSRRYAVETAAPLTSSTIWPSVANPWLLYMKAVPGSTSTRRPGQ